MKPDLLRARLLLVEDHAPTAETLQAMLQAIGFTRISLANSTRQAKEMLEQSPFDMVLCDFRLGMVNGLMLVRMIRRPDGIGNPNVPIVMITAHAEEDRVTEALSAGIDDFLVKPVEPETLARCLASVLERPRTFIKSKTYAGPDRRRKQAANHPGRRQEDSEDYPRIPKNKWFVPPKS